MKKNVSIEEAWRDNVAIADPFQHYMEPTVSNLGQLAFM